MTRIRKLYDKINSKPTPSDIKFEEISKLLKYFKFECRQPSRGGSHYVFTHPEIEDLVTIPRNDTIKKAYIKNALRSINMLIEKDDGGFNDEDR